MENFKSIILEIHQRGDYFSSAEYRAEVVKELVRLCGGVEFAIKEINKLRQENSQLSNSIVCTNILCVLKEKKDRKSI
ncbi:hypothetical protein CCAL6883_08280 [Campylobacter sp. RM6883]|uniref:hypothetical protein n=1 Tax=Campylobacter californiensis TaxID=1032243 RepID=UPI0014511D77|nr:hypothetical protein [Campylobacter sp. RM6914]MBE2985332.1 hypothetical protein [Campylobacter sp. RM6883]MBE2995865.1 hypothetical protein [Campylobacter sp. RM6913]QCD51245.1 hypothetical protein CCAL_1360 [Campylobacter sp. RM6914]